ncbi:centrosomal protein of 19 kDa-like [Bolinopsis microptera]|uniref:centrosomal protein of 19 kDa-like n=1 Tax=Bolinopsis microptera TaxID=2820187 RepID=UPI003079A2A3
MFAPKKCGIRYEPPTLVVEYVVLATGKLHRRSMPLRDVTANSNPDNEARKFKNNPKHGKYLEKISQEKLSRILSKCIKFLKGAAAIGSNKPVRLNLDDDFMGGSTDMDMNKLNDSELQFEKSKMNKDFMEKQIRPGDPDYEYDKEVNYGSGNLGDVECDWDESENSDFSF